LIENQGLGYHFWISQETYHQLKNKSEAMLFCYHQMIHEQFVFFGFESKEERDFFRKLILVSGIGPKLAIRSLSQVHYQDFIQWILAEDEKSISQISGIGKKTASKTILELKDRLPKMNLEGKRISGNQPFQEAGLALESLGFDSQSVQKVLKDLEIQNEVKELEDIIKQALNYLKKNK